MYNDPGENIVTICNEVSDSRPDGTDNRLGDLWWSSHTNIMYIWNSDDINQYFDPVNINESPYTNRMGMYRSIWSCLDEYSQIDSSLESNTRGAANVYSSSIKVIIAETVLHS